MSVCLEHRCTKLAGEGGCVGEVTISDWRGGKMAVWRRARVRPHFDDGKGKIAGLLWGT